MSSQTEEKRIATCGHRGQIVGPGSKKMNEVLEVDGELFDHVVPSKYLISIGSWNRRLYLTVAEDGEAASRYWWLPGRASGIKSAWYPQDASFNERLSLILSLAFLAPPLKRNRVSGKSRRARRRLCRLPSCIKYA